jgi:hypothetical protein
MKHSIHLNRMKHIAHANENTCNMKQLPQHTSETGETFKTYGSTYVYTLATYMYSHGNILNIPIKHLQHTFETDEIFETYTCNIHV